MKLSSTKHLKSLASLLLAAALVVGVCIPAWTSPNAAIAEGNSEGGGSSTTTTTTYSITIDNAVSDETYTAYKLFEVTVNDTNNDGTNDAYSYYIKSENGSLKNALEGIGLTFTESADGTEFLVNQTKSGDVVVFDCGKDSEGNPKTMTAAELAAAINTQINISNSALSQALTSTENAIASIAEGATAASATITVSSAGYYFVDSSLGALCALDTVNGTEQTIYEKNSAPSIDKQVFNPSSDKVYENAYALNADAANGNGAWKDVGTDTEPATVDVCQTVYYKLIVNTGTDTYGDNATGVDANYVIKDTLPAGFTCSADSIKIVDDVNKDTTDSSKAAVWTTDDYSIDTTTEAGKVVITLKSTGKLGKLEEGKNITITYKAAMTTGTNGVKIGVNGQTDGTTSAANTNTATLYYQTKTVDGKETTVARDSDEATVYTYQIGGMTADSKPIIQKVDGKENADGSHTPLAGVKFILSKDVKTTDENGDEITTTYYAEVSEASSGTEGSYYLTSWTITKPAAGNIVTSALKYDDTDTTKVVGGGTIEVKGLDAGTYTLTEVETLDGYNLLNGTITVTITEDGTVKYKYNGSDGTITTNETDGDETITIINNTGAELPSTGGIGTAIFYIVGGLLVVGAVVLLVLRRRSKNSR